jgi:hypothetical protein
MQDCLWLLAPAALGFVLLCLHLERRDGRWHQAGHGTMKRFKDGKWESRPLNRDEIEAWRSEQ